MNVHPTAFIGADVVFGENVSVGPFSIISGKTNIGDNSVIGSHCHIGYSDQQESYSALIIGNNAKIRSHSVIYAGSTFGDNLVTGHRVTVREGTVAKNGLQIGTLSDIQGHCSIGAYTKFHSNVHIGHKSVIEDYVWIFPNVVLTNDPHPPSEFQMGCTIKKYAVIATMSIVLPGVTVGEGALVGAKTLVRGDVSDNMICVGNPGEIVGKTTNIRFLESNRRAYPWRRHFHRGYPASIVEEWRQEFPNS